jgi:transposase
MSELKVEGYEDLVRDTESTAIVNKDKNGYEMYMRKVSMRKTERETVRGLVREVNELREDFKEIKNLLVKMVDNNGR